MSKHDFTVHYIKEPGFNNCLQPGHTGTYRARPLYSFDDIVGLEKTKRLARYLACQSAGVLIAGETGTGKELFASAMHNAGSRNNMPFVAVNCAAIPGSLVESELFGYKRGAFTDARCDRIGRIEYAKGGTLFLDEIGDMPLDVQGKLLRVLETKMVCPLGANEEKPVDVRFFFATNQNLQHLVRKELFRADLYYRVSSTIIHIPALRERKAEIPELVTRLMSKIRNEYDIAKIAISDDALRALSSYDFPGNVRELEGILRSACVKCRNGAIEAIDLGIERPNELSFAEQVARFKLKTVHDCYRFNRGDIGKICACLKISRRQLYRYLRGIKKAQSDTFETA